MEPIKAFSNVVIGQFVLTRIPIKVYVYGRYLTITSTDDVQDPLIGFGMDEDGQMHRFDYKTIEHMLVSNNVVDLDTYNNAMGAETESGEEGEEEEEAPKKEESIKLGEITKDVKLAKQKALDAEEKALKDKQKTLDNEPITEDHGYTIGTGDIVKNINPDCEHFGSIGVVKKIMDLPNGMGKVAVYTVGNSGPTYKPGMSLTKTTDQLEKYNGWKFK